MFRSTLILALFGVACLLPRLAAQTYSIDTVIPGTGDLGYADGPIAEARINIGGMTFDAAGNLYFTDQKNTVRRLSTTGVVSTLAGSPGLPGSDDGIGSAARFGFPIGIAMDAANNLYVADNRYSVIKKITPAGAVTTFAGQADTPGTADGTGSAARFMSPTGLAIDAAGNLYVSEAFAVRKVTPGGVVTTLAMSSFRKPENPGASDVPFAYLWDIALDASGNVYVTDSIRHIVCKITPSGVTTVLAGQPGQRGHVDGDRATARFMSPSGIAVDASGDVLVTDNAGHTLRRISPAGVVTTVAGQIEQRGLVDGVGGSVRLLDPTRLARNPAGAIHIADAYGTRLRRGMLSSAPSAPLLHAVPAVGDLAYQAVGARARVTYTAAASGSAPIALQWFKNDIPIPGATQGTYTIPSASADDEGTYRVTGTNAVGAVTSLPVRLQVFTPALGPLATRHAQPGGSFLWGIASSGSQLVTVGTEGTILSSSDGRTWTRRDSGTTDWLVGVTYGAGKFVAVGDRGIVLLSTDGTSWTRAASSATTQRLNNVTFARNTFVAVGEGGVILTSPDAETWTPRTSPTTGWLRGLAYNGDAADRGLFVTTGQGGTMISSVDGTAWNVYPLQTTNDVEALVPISSYSNFVGIGQDGVVLNVVTSTYYPKFGGPPYKMMGAHLTSTHQPGRLRGLAAGANALFATGENGLILGGQSTSGPWSVIPSGTTANLVGGVFHGNSLFVIGEGETILQSEPLHQSRLINLSTRANVGTDASVMISGFVIKGDAPKRVLLRAAGPALAGLGLNGTLAQPVLTLFDGANQPLGSNAGWNLASNAAEIAETAPRVGAFPFNHGSADAALLVTLPPGSYTAQVSGMGGGAGLSLVEAYDAELLASEGSRAINISTRGQVAPGANRLIAGFVINGAASRRVLIRAVGPSLAPFNLTGTLAEPQLELYNAWGGRMFAAGAWSTQANADELRGAAVLAGAFALQEESKDAAMIVTLAPGSYTVQVSGANDSTGLALVEVYDLP